MPFDREELTDESGDKVVYFNLHGTKDPVLTGILIRESASSKLEVEFFLSGRTTDDRAVRRRNDALRGLKTLFEGTETEITERVGDSMDLVLANPVVEFEAGPNSKIRDVLSNGEARVPRDLQEAVMGELQERWRRMERGA